MLPGTTEPSGHRIEIYMRSVHPKAGLVLVLGLAVWVGTRLTWLRAAESVESAATRAIDLQRTFRLGPKARADRLGVDTGLAKALPWQLGIETDPTCRHDFVFGRTKLPMVLGPGARADA